MIPRERVLAALRHERTDRTPADFWAEPAAWRRLFEYLGYEDADRLFDQLGVDIRRLEARAAADVPVGNGVYQNFPAYWVSQAWPGAPDER